METSSDSPTTANENAEHPRPVLGYSNQSVSPNVIIWCRLLAIGMFALGMERIAVLMTYDLVGRRYMTIYAFISLGVAVAWPVLAWCCWVQAPAIALRMCRDTSIAAGTEKPDVPGEILSVSLLVLGVYEVLESLSFATMIYPMTRSFHDLSDLPWREMAVPLVRLVIGAALIFRNHFATVFLRRFTRLPQASED